MFRDPSADLGNRYESATPPELMAALLEERLPFNHVDWQRSALEMNEPSRLLRLARVKALLPTDNAIEEKATHDITLENYIRLALAAAGDITTLDSFLSHVQHTLDESPDGARFLAQQTLWIWAPAAEIAGLHHHKEALEEAAFRTLLPEEYARICQEYDNVALAAEGGPIARMSSHIHSLLDKQVDSGVTYELSARPKSNYSVWRKRQDTHRQAADIFDLIGFRIIIDAGDEALAIQQCYAAMTAVADVYESGKDRLKDYIAKPKPTGYQSLHVTLYTAAGLPFELQVRTRRMHTHAESDNLLAHQTYDAAHKETPGKILRSYNKVPRFLLWRNAATMSIRDHDGRMDGVLGEDILFFRPDGNLYRIQNGANVLDASFRIHTTRALRTKSITRNGRWVNYQTALQHGDLVDIAYDATPPTTSARFDNLAAQTQTDYARAAVEKGRRQALQDNNRWRGQLIVEQLVQKLNLDDPLSVLDEKDRHELATRAGAPTFNHLLEIIGIDTKSGKPGRVANRIMELCGFGPEPAIKLKPEKRTTLSDEEVLRDLVVPSIGGHNTKPECLVAGCCTGKIARGDPLLVRSSRSDGALKVHRSSCGNIRTLAGTFSCSWV